MRQQDVAFADVAQRLAQQLLVGPAFAGQLVTQEAGGRPGNVGKAAARRGRGQRWRHLAAGRAEDGRHRLARPGLEALRGPDEFGAVGGSGEHPRLAALGTLGGLDAELLNLTELYAPPNGRMLIAEDAHEILGGVAYRRIDSNTCEMKRLVVRSTANGRGLGRKLCEALMQTAGRDGFRTMRLDTTRDMVEAVSLYRSFGFRDVAPFADYPERMRPMMLFMARDLAAV